MTGSKKPFFSVITTSFDSLTSFITWHKIEALFTGLGSTSFCTIAMILILDLPWAEHASQQFLGLIPPEGKFKIELSYWSSDGIDPVLPSGGCGRIKK